MKLRILCLVILSSIVLSACGQEKSNNKPEQKIEQTNNSKSKIISDKIIDGTMVIDFKGKEQTYKFDGDWKAFSNIERSFQRLIYGFSFLDDFFNAYEDTKDILYIKEGYSLIISFVEQMEFDKSKMSWHDETTALRMTNILNFIKKTEQLDFKLSNKDEELLDDNLKKTAELFAFTDFYSGNNNHGFFQDEAGLMYAVKYGRDDIKDICSKRIEKYIKDNFDNDGVHLENSSEYHYVLVAELKKVLDNYDENVIPNYNELKEIYVKSADFAYQTLLPSGIIPNIGDSWSMKINLNDYYSDDILNNRNTNKRQTYYESGYDIYKNMDKKAFLLFRGGYIKNPHHHNDDLSFWLYKDGNIFTEFGSYGYEESNPHTKYQTDFEAHNTLIVDDGNKFKGKDVKITKTDSPWEMSGVTKRISNITFKRNIRFNKDLSNISIIDTVKSLDKQEHKYTRLFHLDPSIQPKIKKKLGKNVVELYRGDKLIGKLITEDEVSLTDDFYYSVYYQNPPQSTKVIKVDCNGIDKEMKVDIELK